MELERAYKIAKQSEVNQDEMVDVVEFFLNKVKGFKGKIQAPYREITNHPFSPMQFKNRSELLLKAYEIASRFTVLLKEDPDRVKDKLYG